MPAIAGLRGTGDWGTDERPKSFREFILWSFPNGQAPLTALLSKMGKESLTDPEFSWYEETLGLMRVQTDATGASATSTSITLTGGGLNFVPGDLLLVEKAESTAFNNEIVEVSSVTSDTVIVVKRGQCGSSGANTGASAYLTKTGNRFGEGSNAPNASTRNPTKLTNLAQIFKTTYEITETAKRTKLRTGDPLKNDKKRKMHDHSVALEMQFLFGRKFEDTDPVTGKPRRSTGGLRQFITTNVHIFSTTPTMSTLIDVTAPIFDYSSDRSGTERIAFCGNGALMTLNKLVAEGGSTRITYDGMINVYGMKLMAYTMPQGTIYLRTHPLMNVHPLYRNSMFIIDPPGLRYRYLRDTKPKDNIQANDADLEKGMWLTEAGLEVFHEHSMAYVGNFVK